MPTFKTVPDELLGQLRRDSATIAAELPDLNERKQILDEAALENSLSGHLRRAIHQSGKSLKRIAADAGLEVFVLCDFLEGTRTLRSDVMDRLAQAVGANIHIDAAKLTEPPTKP